MKENIAVAPTTNAQTPVLPPNIKLPASSSLQITATQPTPPPQARPSHQTSKTSTPVPPLIRGVSSAFKFISRNIFEAQYDF